LAGEKKIHDVDLFKKKEEKWGQARGEKEDDFVNDLAFKRGESLCRLPGRLRDKEEAALTYYRNRPRKGNS